MVKNFISTKQVNKSFKIEQQMNYIDNEMDIESKITKNTIDSGNMTEMIKKLLPNKNTGNNNTMTLFD
jgi:hypothetical protein